MILFLDGRSGSGKTTLAAQLSRRLGWPVVHLDDFYPGWDGLAAGSKMLLTEVLPHYRFQRWDWQQNCPGQWESITPGDLIIEGAGAWTPEIAAFMVQRPHLAVVLEAPAALRQYRALQRDPFYAPFWDQWARQEEVHFRKQPPADLYCDEHSDAQKEVLALLANRGVEFS